MREKLPSSGAGAAAYAVHEREREGERESENVKLIKKFALFTLHGFAIT